MNEEKFIVVFSVDLVENDFVIRGIFSKEEDADSMKAALKSSKDKSCGVCSNAMTMDQIKTQLVKDRLMAMADPIQKLVSSLEARP